MTAFHQFTWPKSFWMEEKYDGSQNRCEVCKLLLGIAFTFMTVAHPILAQSSQSWCLSKTTDQEQSETVFGCVNWSIFDKVTALQRKRAFFLGHPVYVYRHINA